MFLRVGAGGVPETCCADSPLGGPKGSLATCYTLSPSFCSPRPMEVQLIAEVAKWPVLYDTSLEEYKHVEIKNKAWARITYKLLSSTDNFVIEKIKNKWKNLRDTFVKSLRKKGKPNYKPWKLESEMEFLIPYINNKIGRVYPDRSRSSVERLTSPEPVKRMHPLTPNIDMDWLNSYMQGNQGQGHLQRQSDEFSIKREQDESTLQGLDDGSVMQHVETVMDDSQSVIQRRPRPNPAINTPRYLDISDLSFRLEQDPYNPIDCYFLGLAQTVKRMKPLNQVILKKAISNLIFDAEIKELEEVNEATSSSQI